MDTATASSPGLDIWQGSSTFDGNLEVSGGATSRSGNVVYGVYAGSIDQEGSRYGGTVSATEASKVQQGNEVARQGTGYLPGNAKPMVKQGGSSFGSKATVSGPDTELKLGNKVEDYSNAKIRQYGSSYTGEIKARDGAHAERANTVNGQASESVPSD